MNTDTSTVHFPEALGTRLVPRPKRLTPGSAPLSFPRRPGLRLASGDFDLDPAVAALCRSLAEFGIVPQPRAEDPATIVLGVDAGLDLGAEGYRLWIEERGVTITGRDPAGLFYGVQTLLQWLGLHRPTRAQDAARESLSLTAVRIEDWPDFPQRGVMLDISRDKVPTMDSLARLIDRLASWKINQLQLYTEHTFAYPGHEAVWREASPIFPEEARELDALCRKRYIDLVPNQNSFGHFHRWLVHPAYRSLAECPEGIEHPFSDTREPYGLCAVDPGAIELLADLYAKLLPNFQSTRFNVGLDETLDLGLGRSAEACRQYGKEEVYLRFLNQVHALVRRHGRDMQFWADIMIERPDLLPRMPRDHIVALEWGYEPDHPFEAHQTRLRQAGIPFLVCPGTNSWNSIAGRLPEALQTIEKAARSGLAQGADGLLNTDWGDNGHLQPLATSFAGLLAGAAAAWNVAGHVSEDDITELLGTHVFPDPTGNLARATVALGSAHRACGALPRNGTALFWLLIAPADTLDHERYRGLSGEGVEQSRRQIDEALDLLASARPTTADGALAVRELLWAGRLLRLACDLATARLALDPRAPLEAVAPETRRTLGERLAPLRREHEEIWLARNRPGGRLDSRERLDRLQRALG